MAFYLTIERPVGPLMAKAEAGATGSRALPARPERCRQRTAAMIRRRKRDFDEPTVRPPSTATRHNWRSCHAAMSSHEGGSTPGIER